MTRSSHTWRKASRRLLTLTLALTRTLTLTRSLTLPITMTLTPPEPSAHLQEGEPALAPLDLDVLEQLHPQEDGERQHLLERLERLHADGRHADGAERADHVEERVGAG